MTKVCELRDMFFDFAPAYTKFDFDNVGLLVGYSQQEVTRVLVALDITDAVIEEAVEMGAELIVSHHPLIFDPIKSVTDEDEKGRKIVRLLSKGISAICLHTNMDTAQGGVNDALMEAMGVRVTGLLDPHGTHPDGQPFGVSRVGELPEAVSMESFLLHCKGGLKAKALRYYDAGRPVRKIACCGGAGGMDMKKAFEAGCDTFVSADLKYDRFLWAKDCGLNLIDADHFCTENVLMPVLAGLLKRHDPMLEVRISQVHQQVVSFY